MLRSVFLVSGFIPVVYRIDLHLTVDIHPTFQWHLL